MRQAEELGKELAMLKLPIIYASPQLRAQMTAQVVAKHNDTPIETLHDLHETMCGKGEGMYEADLLKEYADVFKSQLNPSAPDFLTAKIPGGESIQDNYDRFDRAVEYIKKNCPYDKAGVASHGTFMAMAFYRLYGVFHEFRNCEYFIIEI